MAGKSISQRAVEGQAIAPQTAEVGGRTYAVKRQVVVPQLKQKDGETVYIKIVDLIHKGKEIKDATGVLKAAQLCTVINLVDGKHYAYLTNAVLEGVLADEYPGGAYIGKSFAVKKLPAPEGKRYKSLEVVEIEEAD